jgi:hypothetical protein
MMLILLSEKQFYCCYQNADGTVATELVWLQFTIFQFHILTMALKMWKCSIFKTIRNPVPTNGLLTHTGNHLRDINKGSWTNENMKINNTMINVQRIKQSVQLRETKFNGKLLVSYIWQKSTVVWNFKSKVKHLKHLFLTLQCVGEGEFTGTKKKSYLMQSSYFRFSFIQVPYF